MSEKIKYVGFEALDALNREYEQKRLEAERQRLQPVQPSSSAPDDPSKPAESIILKENLTDLRSDLEIKDQQISMANIATVANCHVESVQIATGAKIATEANIANIAKITTEANFTNMANIAIEPTNNKPKIVSVIAVANVNGELRIPNQIMDGLLPLLGAAEVVIYLRLYRLSHGYHKDSCIIGFDKLANSTNLSKRTAQTAIENLEKKGLVERVGANLRGQIKGNIYKINLPATLAESATEAKIANIANSANVANSATNKKIFKANLKKDYQKIISDLRRQNTGRPYPLSELAEDVKRICAKDGKEFDFNILNELL